MDSRFINIALEQYIWEDIARSIKDLRSMLHAKHEHEVTMYKVWEAKVPQFLAILNDVDPNIVTLLKCDPHVSGTCIFSSAFWAFGLCIRGFRHCRPVISIDATHLFGKYKGKLLIAMATDGKNEVYPVAFAVVESESTET
ncbi:uncharacterized protein LOC142624198 [Castanea sativa]|uniref:uncharacterized protein LOC142624198 n=1 Tax=Castanea sativa TaxID=21020 RepID=UPI003F64B17F